MKHNKRRMAAAILHAAFLVALTSCAAPKGSVYHDSGMDFGAIRSVAVMPFENLTNERMAAGRVRDVLMTSLISTEAFYVLPSGEIARGAGRAGIRNPATPSPEEVVKLGPVIKADAVITGVIREYGQARSGNTSANLISLGLQIMETQTGKVVWSADTTKGGISTWDRLFGGGGEPMNDVTQEAVDELLDKLFG